MKKQLLVLTLLGSLAAFPAYALDLHAARASGAIGEKTDGYTQALQSSADVTALSTDINAKRKEEYTKISSKNGQPVEVVAKLAAQQILDHLERGAPYQASDGSWKKK